MRGIRSFDEVRESEIVPVLDVGRSNVEVRCIACLGRKEGSSRVSIILWNYKHTFAIHVQQSVRIVSIPSNDYSRSPQFLSHPCFVDKGASTPLDERDPFFVLIGMVRAFYTKFGAA